MKKFFFLLIPAVLILTACGYNLQGFDSPSHNSVLGDGSKTARIVEVEQSTLYSWVSPYVRTKMRDELQLRKLVHMIDSGDADYTLHVKLPYFLIRSSISNKDDETLLSTAQTSLEMEIRDGHTGASVWRSGEIRYSERYTSSGEEAAIETVIDEVIYRLMDRLQQSF